MYHMFICMYCRPKLKRGLWKPNVPVSPTNATARPSTTLKTVSPYSIYLFFFLLVGFFHLLCRDFRTGWLDIRLACVVIMSDPLCCNRTPAPCTVRLFLSLCVCTSLSSSPIGSLSIIFLVYIFVLICDRVVGGRGCRDRVSIGMQSNPIDLGSPDETNCDNRDS